MVNCLETLMIERVFTQEVNLTKLKQASSAQRFSLFCCPRVDRSYKQALTLVTKPEIIVSAVTTTLTTLVNEW